MRTITLQPTTHLIIEAVISKPILLYVFNVFTQLLYVRKTITPHTFLHFVAYIHALHINVTLKVIVYSCLICRAKNNNTNGLIFFFFSFFSTDLPLPNTFFSQMKSQLLNRHTFLACLHLCFNFLVTVLDTTEVKFSLFQLIFNLRYWLLHLSISFLGFKLSANAEPEQCSTEISGILILRFLLEEISLAGARRPLPKIYRRRKKFLIYTNTQIRSNIYSLINNVLSDGET